MLLHCFIHKKDERFISTVLELGIVEQGESIEQVKARTEEAINCYFHALHECGISDGQVEFTPVPLYWLRKMWFDIAWTLEKRRSRANRITCKLAYFL